MLPGPAEIMQDPHLRLAAVSNLLVFMGSRSWCIICLLAVMERPRVPARDGEVPAPWNTKSVLQPQKTVSAHLKSKQLLLFAFASVLQRQTTMIVTVVCLSVSPTKANSSNSLLEK